MTTTIPAPEARPTVLGRIRGLQCRECGELYRLEARHVRDLWLKNDTVNPTFSFKDRPVSIASTRALELGFRVLACASTGNLAGSVAAHAAKAGMQACIFIPADLEPAKIVGASIYEPTIFAVDGNYDDANRLSSEVADLYPWAFVNINLRPYYSEGSKTLAFEVAEQLGWRLPDAVVVPIASGSMFTKVHKGFSELQTVGLVGSGNVRMIGAQAEGCSPVVQAARDNSFDVRPVRPNTIAKSLAIGNPADGYYALKIVQQTGGALEAVLDPEVVDGIKLLARTEGIFAETAGGVTVGVLRKLVETGKLDPDAETVVINSGDGLKTLDAVAEHVTPVLRVAPTLASFEAAYAGRR